MDSLAIRQRTRCYLQDQLTSTPKKFCCARDDLHCDKNIFRGHVHSPEPRSQIDISLTVFSLMCLRHGRRSPCSVSAVCDGAAALV